MTYLVDSAVHRLNNWGQILTKFNDETIYTLCTKTGQHPDDLNEDNDDVSFT